MSSSRLQAILASLLPLLPILFNNEQPPGDWSQPLPLHASPRRSFSPRYLPPSDSDGSLLRNHDLAYELNNSILLERLQDAVATPLDSVLPALEAISDLLVGFNIWHCLLSALCGGLFVFLFSRFSRTSRPAACLGPADQPTPASLGDLLEAYPLRSSYDPESTSVSGSGGTLNTTQDVTLVSSALHCLSASLPAPNLWQLEVPRNTRISHEVTPPKSYSALPQPLERHVEYAAPVATLDEDREDEKQAIPTSGSMTVFKDGSPGSRVGETRAADTTVMDPNDDASSSTRTTETPFVTPLLFNVPEGVDTMLLESRSEPVLVRSSGLAPVNSPGIRSYDDFDRPAFITLPPPGSSWSSERVFLARISPNISDASYSPSTAATADSPTPSSPTPSEQSIGGSSPDIEAVMENREPSRERVLSDITEYTEPSDHSLGGTPRARWFSGIHQRFANLDGTSLTLSLQNALSAVTAMSSPDSGPGAGDDTFLHSTARSIQGIATYLGGALTAAATTPSTEAQSSLGLAFLDVELEPTDATADRSNHDDPIPPADPAIQSASSSVGIPSGAEDYGLPSDVAPPSEPVSSETTDCVTTHATSQSPANTPVSDTLGQTQIAPLEAPSTAIPRPRSEVLDPSGLLVVSFPQAPRRLSTRRSAQHIHSELEQDDVTPCVHTSREASPKPPVPPPQTSVAEAIPKRGRSRSRRPSRVCLTIFSRFRDTHCNACRC